MRKNRDLNEKCRELLRQAKIGNPTAKKKLGHLGLRYWEHKGRVIVKRTEAGNTETGLATTG